MYQPFAGHEDDRWSPETGRPRIQPVDLGIQRAGNPCGRPRGDDGGHLAFHSSSDGAGAADTMPTTWSAPGYQPRLGHGAMPPQTIRLSSRWSPNWDNAGRRRGLSGGSSTDRRARSPEPERTEVIHAPSSRPIPSTTSCSTARVVPALLRRRGPRTRGHQHGNAPRRGRAQVQHLARAPPSPALGAASS